MGVMGCFKASLLVAQSRAVMQAAGGVGAG